MVKDKRREEQLLSLDYQVASAQGTNDVELYKVRTGVGSYFQLVTSDIGEVTWRC